MEIRMQTRIVLNQHECLVIAGPCIERQTFDDQGRWERTEVVARYNDEPQEGRKKNNYELFMEKIRQVDKLIDEIALGPSYLRYSTLVPF